MWQCAVNVCRAVHCAANVCKAVHYTSYIIVDNIVLMCAVHSYDCIYTCVCVWMHTRTHVHTHTCVRTYMHINTATHMQVCTYVHTHVCTCIYSRAHARKYVHTHIHSDKLDDMLSSAPGQQWMAGWTQECMNASIEPSVYHIQCIDLHRYIMY